MLTVREITEFQWQMLQCKGGGYRLSARLRYLRWGREGQSRSHVNLQLLRNSSHTLAMTTAAGGASESKVLHFKHAYAAYFA
jgi:hypothetical protein